MSNCKEVKSEAHGCLLSLCLQREFLNHVAALALADARRLWCYQPVRIHMSRHSSSQFKSQFSVPERRSRNSFLTQFLFSTVHPWCLERFMLLQQDVTSANVCSTVATFERGIFRTKPDFSFPEGMKMQIIWSSWLTISCFGIKRRNNAFLFFSLLFFLLFWSRRIPKSTVHFRS